MSEVPLQSHVWCGGHREAAGLGAAGLVPLSPLVHHPPLPISNVSSDLEQNKTVKAKIWPWRWPFLDAGPLFPLRFLNSSIFARCGGHREAAGLGAAGLVPLSPLVHHPPLPIRDLV